MADPRLGPPVLTEHGVVFLLRTFDARNPEFASTSSEPRRPPPVLRRDGTVGFQARQHASLAGRTSLASLAGSTG
jgi:hypothetical protein